MRLLLLIVLFAIPSFAQNDFVGEWAARYHEDQTERIAGPDIGDYLGIPLNDAARLRADSWDASILTLPEWQCRPHPADYGTRGPANLRVWKDVDPATQQVMSYHTHVQWQAQERTIWMDDRPHPAEDAPHTWQGFSTGKWEGNQLTVITTHLKESYVRRNGVPRSDRAILIEHWIRHGDYLTLVSIIDDPVYLAEPFIRTTNWAFDPGQAMEPYPCEVAEEIQRPEGVIPHHLPGENAFLPEFPRKIGIPEQAARGGADTMYPEYIAKMHNPSLAVVAAPAAPASASGPAEIHVQRVRGDIYMLSGAGGNITIQIGNDGVLLVDAGLADMTGRVLEEVKKLSTRPVRYIVDTHVHADHIGGNERIAKQGQTIAGGDVARLATDATEGAAILAHQNVMNRMTGSQPPAPF